MIEVLRYFSVLILKALLFHFPMNFMVIFFEFSLKVVKSIEIILVLSFIALSASTKVTIKANCGLNSFQITSFTRDISLLKCELMRFLVRIERPGNRVGKT